MTFLLLGAAGCVTHTKSFNADRTEIGPKTYIVAMSINTTIQAGKPAETFPYFGIEQIEIRGGNTILIYDLEPGLGLLVLEYDEPLLQLDNLVLFWNPDNQSRMHFMTATTGPSVELNQGAVTYIGSLIVVDE